MRKWLVYGHKLQAWNALKYVTLMLGPISLIIYLETGIGGKLFFILYLFWKTVSSFYKLFWDFYYDWGLLRGTLGYNRLLRDKIKYHPAVYYICMVFDFFGLFFWAFVILLYNYGASENPQGAAQSLEFYNNVAYILWFELIVLAIRRSIWILIRFESEFQNNYE